MRFYLLLFLSFSFAVAKAQKTDHSQDAISNSQLLRDSLNIKDQLVELALQNSDLETTNVNARIAEYNIKKAKAAWLDMLSVTGNLNELTVNKSTYANYWPKYNFGIGVPLGTFGRRNNDVKIAKEQVTLNEIQRNEKIKAIRTEVLERFENYLEKKDLYELQIENTQAQYTIFLKSKSQYAASSIPIERLSEVNKYYNEELMKQRTAEKNLNVAFLDLEEMVGFRLRDVLTKYNLAINK